jgi:hypothetical protein
MVNVYADLIMKGKKTLEQVPERIRQEVYEVLIARGWVPPDGEGGNE